MSFFNESWAILTIFCFDFVCLPIPTMPMFAIFLQHITFMTWQLLLFISLTGCVWFAMAHFEIDGVAFAWVSKHKIKKKIKKIDPSIRWLVLHKLGWCQFPPQVATILFMDCQFFLWLVMSLAGGANAIDKKGLSMNISSQCGRDEARWGYHGICGVNKNLYFLPISSFFLCFVLAGVFTEHRHFIIGEIKLEKVHWSK